MKRTEVFKVKLTTDEKTYIVQLMKNSGYSNASEFARTRLIYPEKRNKKSMQGMLYEVNKIGVNLNQIVFEMHRQKRIDDDLIKAINETNKLLNEVLDHYGRI